MDRQELRRAWDAVADDYASTRRADGEDAALIDELLEGLPEAATVLDVGCGDGMRTLANLAGVDRIGLDLSSRQLELAAENVPEAHLIQGEMTRLPLAANAVDAITAYHAVFHVPQTEHPAVYGEFARVLRPGGRLLATVGSSRYETTRHDWLGSGQSMFFSTPGRRRTRSSLEAAGFAIIWERVVDDPLGSSVPFVLAEYRGQ
ncbi:class I SAM-dependent methyltransferase [Natronorubrum bangense]|uniref:S-adenosylmethionine-dependent methyltransferase 3 n=2 Tax=Natronorubrum bangense TaxID=61858 RepID=L9WLZ8_9EURY|nr:class I SAM-dependent methyltransferase [Natronorubrum bangense]ELY50256.1 S-adenosylmethionine-dependent methyltransferase 3 [Natronorubrum bangense JCM 10635]QCC54298.1 class I SAM-dependent methyltransferase [Natronorubrum bangense]